MERIAEKILEQLEKMNINLEKITGELRKTNNVFQEEIKREIEEELKSRFRNPPPNIQ